MDIHPIRLGAGMGMTAFEMTTTALPGASSSMDMSAQSSGMSSEKGMGSAIRMAHATIEVILSACFLGVNEFSQLVI